MNRLVTISLCILSFVGLAILGSASCSSPEKQAGTAPKPTRLPPDAIGITIVTNDTKAEWLGLVTEAFNKSAVKTSAGHRVVVQMIQESSPAPTVKKIVAGELQPTLWSPSDISLDRSGSMKGEKLTNAVAATGSFIARLDPKDRVQLTAFDQSLLSFGLVEDVATVRDRLPPWLSQVRPGSSTALNDAICAAVKTAEAARLQDRAAGKQRLYGIVVLTDGKENASSQRDVFACLPNGEDVEGVKVFTIAYGNDADKDVLKKIAERTNGKTFSGDPATIEQVYLAISAEQ